MQMDVTEEERLIILNRRECEARRDAYARANWEAANLAGFLCHDGKNPEEVKAAIMDLPNPWK